jgi:hypothetical protein
MAKGNTWQKKLMHKSKVFALKSKLGNEEGILSRGGASNAALSQALYREALLTLQAGKMGVPDGDCPDKPAKLPPKVTVKEALPRAAGWRPRAFGKRQASGCFLK